MDNIILIGAEDIRAGGNSVREGAREMRGVVAEIEIIFRRHEQFLDEWLLRFEKTIESLQELKA